MQLLMSVPSDAAGTMYLAEETYALFPAGTNYLWNSSARQLWNSHLKVFGNSATNILTFIWEIASAGSNSKAFPG